MNIKVHSLYGPLIQQALAEITAKPEALDKISDDAAVYAGAAATSVQKSAGKFVCGSPVGPAV